MLPWWQARFAPQGCGSHRRKTDLTARDGALTLACRVPLSRTWGAYVPRGLHGRTAPLPASGVPGRCSASRRRSRGLECYMDAIRWISAHSHTSTRRLCSIGRRRSPHRARGSRCHGSWCVGCTARQHESPHCGTTCQPLERLTPEQHVLGRCLWRLCEKIVFVLLHRVGLTFTAVRTHWGYILQPALRTAYHHGQTVSR